MGDCFLMGHGGYSLPKLNSLQSVNLTDYNQSATFTVSFAKHGRPKKYTYEWYISEDGSSWNTITKNGEQSLVLSGMDYKKEQYWIKCKVINKKGFIETNEASLTLTPIQPYFTYIVNGANKADDSSYVSKSGWGTSDWKLKFLQSGVLTFINRGNAKNGIDLFLVGGGGGGRSAQGMGRGGGGGGGGYTITKEDVSVSSGTNYTITVGAGGEIDSSGEASKAFGLSANGGTSTPIDDTDVRNGCNGGSGGGCAGWDGLACESGYLAQHVSSGDGGSDGSNGENTGGAKGGKGQGGTYSTREFGKENGQKYSGGGAGGRGSHIHQCSGYGGQGEYSQGGEGGGGNSGESGTPNTGGGGGGQNSGDGSVGTGGSGIVIIKNAR